MLNVNSLLVCLPQILSSADDGCKQFGPRSGPTEYLEKSNDVKDLQVTKTISKNSPTCKELNV